MKIEIIERNYDVGKRLSSLIIKKIEKLDRYFNDDAVAKVVVSEQNKNFKLEVTISAKGILYRSECYGENMFDNLDIVLPKIERQIIKYCEKNRDKFKKSAFDKKKREFIKEDVIFEKSDIVKRKEFELLPITMEDAKEYLENLNHDFYVFLNKETSKVNVLYLRKNGSMGLIECKY